MKKELYYCDVCGWEFEEKDMVYDKDQNTYICIDCIKNQRQHDISMEDNEDYPLDENYN